MDTIPTAAWERLAGRAIEPNAFYDPGWARAVSAHAPGYAGATALLAWDGPARRRLIGLLPVVSAWRALKLPFPMLVAWQPYAPLTTPFIDREATAQAARGLLDAAAATATRALLLRFLPAAGPAAAALRAAFAERGIEPLVLRRYERSRLDATQDSETLLHATLGAKKLKELRRQRKRLADSGAVTFEVASKAAAVAVALENFLALEASGWKGRRGTALNRIPGNAAFIRQAASALAAKGQFAVATLNCAGAPVAAGLVLRQGKRAFFFKVAYDEARAKMSPGVQLTLELTRYLSADPAIDDVDSMADTDHPMIDRVWNDRLELADFLFATRAGDPLVPLMGHVLTAGNAARDAVSGLARRLRAIIEMR